MRLAIICFLFFAGLSSILAQNIIQSYNEPIIPEKSPLFANDIIIDNKPDRDQRLVSICSAFNGWLYVVYGYYSSNIPQASILRSMDNGLTWNLLIEGPISTQNTILKRLEIISAGTTLENFKIYLGFVLANSTGSNSGAQVFRYNGEPFTGEGSLIYTPGIITDLAISTDNFYTPSNANPYCFAMTFVKRINSTVGDSLIFESSSNGGLPDNYKSVTSLSGYFGQLQLSYGKRMDQNSGRFYIVWEDKDSELALLGHIYTTHTEPTFASAFTPPICLDCSDPVLSNKCRRPVIASHYGNMDNDSSNITTAILLEYYNQSTNSYNLKGYYSCNSTFSTFYTPFTMPVASNNNQQPDICFNPFDSTFSVTYFDSINKTLHYLTNNFNFTNPNSWNNISSDYNDQQNIIIPIPKVRINQGNKVGLAAWTSEGGNGNGITLFDAVDHYYTGVGNLSNDDLVQDVNVFPNPCNSFTNLTFSIKKPLHVSIVLYNSNGIKLNTITNRIFNSGRNSVELITQFYPAGVYSYFFKLNNAIKVGKIIIFH
jgi:hypothetical protein